jgi:hypothetical protein
MSGYYPEGYTPPQNESDSYFKPKAGTHKLRIIGRPEFYFVGWSEQNGTRKAHRARTPDPSIQVDKWQNAEACLVYNYDLKKLQLWEITQATLRDKLFSLATDADFGDPTTYDIKVERKGEGLDTTYDIKALSKSEPSQDILDALKKVEGKVDFEGYLKGEQFFKS